MNIDRFIECSKGKRVTIHVDPKSPSVKKLLYAGFGRPKLFGNNLSLTKIQEEPFMYMRDTVVPTEPGKPLPFSKHLLSQLKEISGLPNEWGGQLVFVKEMVMSTMRQGTEATVNMGFSLSKYMFHSHPSSEYVPYSFYSSEDLGRYLSDTAKYGSARKDYLVTDKGLFSLQISDKLVTAYKKYPVVRTIAMKLQEYLISNILTRFNIDPAIQWVTIYETVDWINHLTGEKAINIIIENELLSVDDLKQVKVVTDVGRFYYVNMIEWELVDRLGFTDVMYNIPTS